MDLEAAALAGCLWGCGNAAWVACRDGPGVKPFTPSLSKPRSQIPILWAAPAHLHVSRAVYLSKYLPYPDQGKQMSHSPVVADRR